MTDVMDESTFTYRSADGLDIAVRRWSATRRGRGPPVGSVQIAHGMGEHSARYARLAEALTAHGWVVYADDHRGHGRSAVGLDGAGPPEALGDFGPGGLERAGRRPGACWASASPPRCRDGPHLLLGHSMGSFAAQQLVLDHSRTIDGLILSGTTAVDLAATTMDPEAETDLTALNAAFEPARTPFDWLSRDETEVDAYLADPWCGFGIDRAATASLVAAAPRLADPDGAGRHPLRPARLRGGRLGRPAQPGPGPARPAGAALPRRRADRHHHRLLPRRPPRGVQRDQP